MQVQRGLVGEIIGRFERRGYQLVGLKMVHASQEHIEKHYADLAGKPFFPGLVKYMSSGPVVAMVWQGKDVVKQGRVILGATNPLASQPGTIRGDFAIDVGRNICHGSDAVESAKKESEYCICPSSSKSFSPCVWSTHYYSLHPVFYRTQSLSGSASRTPLSTGSLLPTRRSTSKRFKRLVAPRLTTSVRKSTPRSSCQ